MTKAELLAIVDDMRARIEVGDSYEGYLNYLMPEEADDWNTVDFRVEARYRVGNLEGQGGMRMIGVKIG